MAEDGVTFDLTQFDDAIRGLRESAERFESTTLDAMDTIGRKFTETAKVVASVHSKSIPETIHMYREKHDIVIQAGSRKVQLAALYELGNRGGKRGGRKSPTFAHPVFATGNRKSWTWVPNEKKGTPGQKRYPFFAPTRKLLRRWYMTEMEDIWTTSLEPFLKTGDDGA